MRQTKIPAFPFCFALFLLTGCSYHATNVDRSFSFTPATDESLGSAYPAYSYVERSSHKLLFIGNSFTYYNDIPFLIEKMGKELGLSLSCVSFTKGSQTLFQSADSSDELGAQIEAEIRTFDDYTDVILQEQSTYPLDYPTVFHKGARLLRAKIGAAEKKASFHFYGTWGYQNLALSHNISIVESEALLRNEIETTATSLGADVGEVGKAFSYVLTKYPNVNLYSADAKHPSFAGSFLSALVQLASYTHVDVRNVTFSGEEGTTNDYGETFISATNAAILRDVAYKAAFNQI